MGPNTPGMTKERYCSATEGKGGDVQTYTSKRRFCFSSKKKSSTNFLTKSGFSVLSITSVRPNWRRDRGRRDREEDRVNTSGSICVFGEWENKKEDVEVNCVFFFLSWFTKSQQFEGKCACRQ